MNAILFTVLSLFLLALYFTQKGHVEYLWLALHELVQAPIGFVDLAGSTARLDQLWYAAIILQLVVISAYLYFEFLVAFLALPRRWYIRVLRYTAPVLLGVGPGMLLLGTPQPSRAGCDDRGLSGQHAVDDRVDTVHLHHLDRGHDAAQL